MRHPVSRSLRSVLVALILLLGVASVVLAQETSQIGRLFITDSNTEGFPSIRLQVFGIDGQGMPIDFATEPLFVTHDGFPVEEVVFDGKTPVGSRDCGADELVGLAELFKMAQTVLVQNVTARVCQQREGRQDALEDVAGCFRAEAVELRVGAQLAGHVGRNGAAVALLT